MSLLWTQNYSMSNRPRVENTRASLLVGGIALLAQKWRQKMRCFFRFLFAGSSESSPFVWSRETQKENEEKEGAHVNTEDRLAAGRKAEKLYPLEMRRTATTTTTTAVVAAAASCMCFVSPSKRTQSGINEKISNSPAEFSHFPVFFCLLFRCAVWLIHAHSRLIVVVGISFFFSGRRHVPLAYVILCDVFQRIPFLPVHSSRSCVCLRECDFCWHFFSFDANERVGRGRMNVSVYFAWQSFFRRRRRHWVLARCSFAISLARARAYTTELCRRCRSACFPFIFCLLSFCSSRVLSWTQKAIQLFLLLSHDAHRETLKPKGRAWKCNLVKRANANIKDDAGEKSFSSSSLSAN